MAIAQAVIEFLHDRIGCKTLVSTHFHELAHLEESLVHLRNHCMAVKESGRQVTFLRKLIPGAASTSYGIYCAEIAGLPDAIIQRSYELLNGFEERAAGADRRPPLRLPLPCEPAAAPIRQLSLFEEDSPAKVAVKKKPDGKSQLVLDQLKGIDLINMTPLQALNLVYEWKQKLQ